MPWSYIEVEWEKHGRRTGFGVARRRDVLRTVGATAAASWDRLGRHRIASLLLVVRPNLPRIQQLHAESVRECGVDVRLVLLVVPHRCRRNLTPWRRRICLAPRPRTTRDELRCDQAAPAIQTAATAFGAGIREAGFGVAGVAGSVVRVKCRRPQRL